jgi:glycosyltransferase involved in cell wall biosynthesis
MKKINLLFDARVIAGSLKKRTSDRSGVFFVALNLLRAFFNDSTHYAVSVYVSDRKQARTIKHYFSSVNLTIVMIQDKDTFVKNIDAHKQNIQTSSNMFKKLLCYLKILKNLLRLTRYKYFNTNLSTLGKFEAFLSPVDEIPEEIRKYPHIKRFIVIHDMIPFLKLNCYEYHDFKNHLLHSVLKKLDYDYYFFVSKKTKSDFVKYTSESIDEKLLVTPIASANNFIPLYNKEKLTSVFKKYKIHFNQNDKYIFSFCSLEPRKNLIFTIKCFIVFLQKNKINDLYFLLGGAGGEGWKNYDEAYKKEINKVDDEYKDRIIHLGYVSDDDVNILYSNSLFFAYLSKYEGFGMPPLEAMQSGTPVITSNNSSLPEVVGDAGILIDCESEEQCIKAFETLYHNEELRKDYIRKGIERAKLFTWEKTVNKMSEAIISTL